MKFTFPPESKPLDGYTIKRAIHRGGFGEVYYALSDGGKEVALKLLQHHMDIELRGVSQCLNLKHPNLITIFDIRTDADGDHWIVMEYVSGKSLDVVMSEQGGPLPLDEVSRWLEGMAAGLAFLHDRGIVHRDLKPANIYREGGIVKIGDVGLAKYISESRRSAQTESVGTVYYMAPEVARGRYGREVDIYSLGIMLYELLTGDVPFDGESTAEILMKHLSETPDLSPLPVALRPVVANALAKDPMRRTPSAGQLLDEFHQALAGVEVAAVIPEDSFVDETVTDSSVAIREQTERYDEFVLRLPKGSGKKLRKVAEKARKQFRKVAHHAGIEARKAAEQARRDARQALRFAQKQRMWERRTAVNGHAVAQHARGEYFPPTRAHGMAGSRRERRFGKFAPWIFVGAVALVMLTLAAPAQSKGLFVGATALSVYAALGYGVYRLIVHVSKPSRGSLNGGRGAQAAAEPIFDAPPSGAGDGSAAANPPRNAGPVAVPVRTVHPAAYSRTLSPATERQMTSRNRMTDLTGSMTWAALLTLAATLGLFFTTPILNSTALAGLFGLTTLLGVWSLMAPAKLMEGRSVDSGAMRLIQLSLGAIVGMAAFWLDSTLMAEIPSNRDMVGAVFFDVGSHHLIAEHSKYQPALAGYIVFFGALFGVRRWWWQIDSFRKRRFRVMSVALTAGLALGLSFVWAFPKDWAVLWAVAISCIVQLASGWTRPKDRLPVVEGASHVA